MFKFLKEKLKKATSIFSKKVEEESKEEEKEEEKAEEVKPEIKKEKPKEEIKEVEEIIKPKKGIFKRVTERITKKVLSDKKFESLFYDLEIVLMENNVAVEVIEKIKEDLKKKLVNQPLARTQIQNIIQETLKQSINELFDVEKIDLIEKIREKKEKPFVIVFVGVNGSGKTSAIAKLTKLIQDNNLSVVLGAGDSFRKAAIEQLEEWGKRLGVKVIKHDYGADPAAVCFDTVSFGKSHNIDAVLLDTAGRQHANLNLMEEMKKIVKVAKPDLKVLVAESIIGNDAVEQAQIFDEAVDIDAIILTKTDVDEKGGAMVSMGYVTKKPIIYLSCGQNLDDLELFEPNIIIESLGLSAS